MGDIGSITFESEFSKLVDDVDLTVGDHTYEFDTRGATKLYIIREINSNGTQRTDWTVSSDDGFNSIDNLVDLDADTSSFKTFSSGTYSVKLDMKDNVSREGLRLLYQIPNTTVYKYTVTIQLRYNTDGNVATPATWSSYLLPVNLLPGGTDGITEAIFDINATCRHAELQFVVKENNAVYQYSLDVPYDVSKAVYDKKIINVSSEETSPQSMTFNDDGTKMYVIGTAGDSIVQYSLSTAYDVSTASYDGATEEFSVAGEETSPQSMTFNGDGTKMYITNNSGMHGIPQNVTVNMFGITRTGTDYGVINDFKLQFYDTIHSTWKDIPDSYDFEKLDMFGTREDERAINRELPQATSRLRIFMNVSIGKIQTSVLVIKIDPRR